MGKCAEMKFPENTRFLLVRTDKIGDVILTTPSITLLKKIYPKAFIGFLCTSYTKPLLKNNPYIDQFFCIDEPETLKKIKSYNFDVSIHFYVDTQSVLLSFNAKIPIRIGPFSKISALLLNKRIIQQRSKVKKHEAEYNLDLIHFCGKNIEKTFPEIFLLENELLEGKSLINSILKNSEKKPIIIHPGSAGSVQTWPLSFFIELSHKLASLSEQIIFTGGKGEESILEKAKITYHSNIHTITAGQLELRELASVIANSKLMISNSTGPLHIASALNIPTLSFYPLYPIVTSAKRWGPYSNSKNNIILTPPQETDPLETITVLTAFQASKTILNLNTSQPK